MSEESDNEYLEIICQVRGKVIQSCTELELVMDMYIAEHFCENEVKTEEMLCIILAPRLPWREKLEIFSILIEKYNKHFLNEFKDYKNGILSIIENRNVFAHYPSDITPSGIKKYEDEGIIRFFKFKNMRMPVTKEIVYMGSPIYTKDQISHLLLITHLYIVAIKKLIKAI